MSAAALLVACSPGPACEQVATDPSCPDLRFSGQHYDEWRQTELPAVTEELGDAAYPACNEDEDQDCGPDLEGHGATDVWRLRGVDSEQALIGYRRGTETPVIFVHRGVDPSSVPGLMATRR